MIEYLDLKKRSFFSGKSLTSLEPEMTTILH